MAKLIGNKPSQVPTNGDLGTLAFQDSDNVIVENLTVSGSSSKLVVEDNSTDAALRVTQTGTGNALVVEDSTNPDSTPFVVNASGNVGIGGSPSVNLEISSDQPTLRLKDTDTALSDDEMSSQIEFYQSDTFGSGVGASISAYGQGSTGLLNLRFATGSNSEAMRIDSSGNVGIKEGSPQSDLHISDSTATNIRLEETTGSSYSVLQTDTAGTLLAADLGNNRASTVLRFSVDGSERMRIGSTGEIGLSGANYGTSGQVLTSGGSGAAPTWADVSGGMPIHTANGTNVGVGEAFLITSTSVLPSTWSYNTNFKIASGGGTWIGWIQPSTNNTAFRLAQIFHANTSSSAATVLYAFFNSSNLSVNTNINNYLPLLTIRIA